MRRQHQIGLRQAVSYESPSASIGDIIAFEWYTFLLLNPVYSLNSFSDLQRSPAAMERVFEVLAMERDKPDRPDARDAPAVVRKLRFVGSNPPQRVVTSDFRLHSYRGLLAIVQ